MKGLADHASALSSIRRLLLQPVQPELAEVEQMLRRELRSRHAFVDELVRYGCLLGGKRLRPSLLLLAGQSVGQLQPEHVTVATVIEMIHTATLIHDDVLDGAATRRRLATVHARWDAEASILLGDFLFTHAFYLASTLGSTEVCRRIGQTTNIVCEGELRQKGSRGDLRLSEQEYLEIVEAKTAELCACGCALGAVFAGAGVDVIERFDRFGRYLGIAFQITDDVLDLVGSEQETGKSLGTDLDKRKPTLPLIRLMALVSDAERLEIERLFDSELEHLQDALWPYLQRYDAVDYARRTAVQFADRARRELDQLPVSPALQSLLHIADFAVHRTA